MFNFLKKIFSIFLIFNLTFVSSAQAAAAATFDNINGDGTGFDVSTQTSTPTGIAFNSDGTKMFLSDKNDKDIDVYTLSTGFNLSTATFSGTSFDVSTQASSNQGIAFNNDGTKMFMIDNSTGSDDVNEYTLSVGFDLASTVNHVDINSDGTGFSVNTQEGNPTGIAFNNDGTKMFIIGTGGREVNVYALSTGFDTSNVTHDDFNGDGSGFDVSDQESAPMGVAFNNDGTRMFVIKNLLLWVLLLIMTEPGCLCQALLVMM